MKNVFNAIVIVLAIVGLIFLGKLIYDYFKTEEISEISRFKLFQGPYRVEDMRTNKVTEHTALFLLDTVTGKVQRYFASITPSGTYMEGWVDTEFKEKVPDLGKEK